MGQVWSASSPKTGDEALDSVGRPSNYTPMGDKTGIVQKARDHWIVTGVTVVGAIVATVLQIVDSPTVSRFLGTGAATTSSSQSSENALSVSSGGSASGELAIREDVRVSTQGGAGPRSITFTTDGNSAERNLVASIQGSVRREIAAGASAQTGSRVAIVLDSLSFGGAARSASFTFAIESAKASGQCSITIKFGTNSELSSALARRVAQTLNDSMKQGEIACA